MPSKSVCWIVLLVTEMTASTSPSASMPMPKASREPESTLALPMMLFLTFPCNCAAFVAVVPLMMLIALLF